MLAIGYWRVPGLKANEFNTISFLNRHYHLDSWPLPGLISHACITLGFFSVQLTLFISYSLHFNTSTQRLDFIYIHFPICTISGVTEASMLLLLFVVWKQTSNKIKVVLTLLHLCTFIVVWYIISVVVEITASLGG